MKEIVFEQMITFDGKLIENIGYVDSFPAYFGQPPPGSIKKEKDRNKCVCFSRQACLDIGCIILVVVVVLLVLIGVMALVMWLYINL